MKTNLLRWGAFLLTLICVVAFVTNARTAEDLGGFTPNPQITFSIPPGTYAPGSPAPATVTITGPVSSSGSWPVSIRNLAGGPEVMPSFSLIIGGAPGTNRRVISIPLPDYQGEASFAATAVISGQSTESTPQTVTLRRVVETVTRDPLTGATTTTSRDVETGTEVVYTEPLVGGTGERRIEATAPSLGGGIGVTLSGPQNGRLESFEITSPYGNLTSALDDDGNRMFSLAAVLRGERGTLNIDTSIDGEGYAAGSANGEYPFGDGFIARGFISGSEPDTIGVSRPWSNEGDASVTLNNQGRLVFDADSGNLNLGHGLSFRATGSSAEPETARLTSQFGDGGSANVGIIGGDTTWSLNSGSIRLSEDYTVRFTATNSDQFGASVTRQTGENNSATVSFTDGGEWSAEGSFPALGGTLTIYTNGSRFGFGLATQVGSLQGRPFDLTFRRARETGRLYFGVSVPTDRN